MGRYIEIVSENEPDTPRPMPLPLLIGGGEGCAITIPGVKKAICLLGEEKGHLFIQPLLEDEPVFLNNERIKASTWVKSGDLLRIGGYLVLFSISLDLVTVTIKRALPTNTEDTGSYAREQIETATSTSEDQRVLPRVETATTEKSMHMWRKAGLILGLFLLCLASVFVFFSKGFEVRITPTPDSMEIKGPFPVVGFGPGFLGMAGHYRLFAKRKGYHDLKGEIDLSGSKRIFSFEMEPLPAVVDFLSRPGGAAIRLDEKDLGLTPLKNVEVAPGNHALLVTLKGFRHVSKKIEIEGPGERQRFEFDLVPVTGLITVKSEPQGAKIKVDNQETGMKTPATLTILEGRHILSLNLAGYSEKRLEVNVTAGKKKALKTVKLQKGPGIVIVNSTPTRALVSVDGKFQGRTPLDLKLSPRKEHVILISAKGYRDSIKKIRLKPGEEKKLSFSLTPRFASLFITSDPENLELFIDGKKQAKNAGEFTLIASSHKIMARAEGYKTKTIRIKLIPDTKKALDIRLKRKGEEKAATSSKARAHPAGFILVRPHPFVMGSPRREQGRRTNEVQKRVVLERPFFMAKKLVTNRQFRMFSPNHSSGSFGGESLDGGEQPVVNVSWEQAARYCNWLSKKEGLSPFYIEKAGKMVPKSPANQGYRLPTEAEWAFVARVMNQGKRARYPWPGTFPPRLKSGNYADESARAILPVVIRGYLDSFPVTSPVASFASNPAGVFDMGGNVAEWCNDFYSPLGPPTEKDPLGPGAGTHHVVRGSSWRDASITRLRLSFRGYEKKGEDYIGFRVCRYK